MGEKLDDLLKAIDGIKRSLKDCMMECTCDDCERDWKAFWEAYEKAKKAKEPTNTIDA